MDLEALLKAGSNIPSVIDREKFLANQAVIILGVELFVLFDNSLYVDETIFNILAIVLLKISAVLLGCSFMGASLLILRLGYAKDQIFAMTHSQNQAADDRLNKHLDFAIKAIPVVGNLWVLGLFFAFVVAAYTIFIL